MITLVWQIKSELLYKNHTHDLKMKVTTSTKRDLQKHTMVSLVPVHFTYNNQNDPEHFHGSMLIAHVARSMTIEMN